MTTILGCPNEPCDGDERGSWCEIINSPCKDEFTDDDDELEGRAACEPNGKF